MKFDILKYKKLFKLYRYTVVFMITILIFIVILTDIDQNSNYDLLFLISGLLTTLYKLIFFFNSYYKKTDVLFINNKLVNIGKDIYEKEVLIFLSGYKGMTSLKYLPLFFIFYFYYPKSGRAIVHDGINIIKIGNKKLYFLIETKEDFEKLLEISHNNPLIKIKKW